MRIQSVNDSQNQYKQNFGLTSPAKLVRVKKGSLKTLVNDVFTIGGSKKQDPRVLFGEGGC